MQGSRCVAKVQPEFAVILLAARIASHKSGLVRIHISRLSTQYYRQSSQWISVTPKPSLSRQSSSGEATKCLARTMWQEVFPKTLCRWDFLAQGVAKCACDML